ncbi:MAG: DNA adenine methylase [Candidatus Coatesbacteria bacterium]|nr:MAG: DNA adenine methylase [Candidatus Coatesbacteria bacterium]
MKPFISIIGGKTRRARRLAELLPTARCYVEVFGGSAAVLFAKERSSVEIYNDADGELVNLFKTVRDRPGGLSEALRFLPASREFYRELLNGSCSDGDSVRRAAAYYFVLRNSFSCKPGAGFRSSRAERSRYSMFADFTKWSERLDRVYIEDLDFEDVIEKYDGPDTIFFVDPPYPGRERYYNGGFKPEDHERLRDVLAGTRGKWLLTYADTREIRELYGGYHIRAETVPYSASLDRGKRRPPANELVISDYDTEGE